MVASTKTPIRADTQWYEVTLDFTAPKDCTAVTVTITENTWLRVDDVSLVEIIQGGIMAEQLRGGGYASTGLKSREPTMPGKR